MNTSEEVKLIYPGTTISQVSAIQSVVEEIEGTQPHINNSLREDLAKLLAASKTNLTGQQYEELRHLVQKYEGVFAASDLGRTDVVKHKINTGGARPIKQHLRRIPGNMGQEVDKVVQNMLDRGIIKKSSSPWSSGIVLVKKKDGTMPFCVDYRRLNATRYRCEQWRYRCSVVSDSG
ncbi:uncharacterized protein LOC110461785 [Mizuhopecten yessoensis]|uniref:uncharacterized protein LOC110461785 n=1 Tax=Mizuhopecten yessoensis TaxID=6573 RepID=UPI000B45B0E9|nr:uncharacterized protein LOC110461785 [Mizuhopecten yessoensis]